MHRALIPSEAVQGESITISDPTTIHHLCDVLRIKPGDRLECFDGHGQIYAGSVTQCAQRRLLVAIERRTVIPPPTFHMTLAQALIKPDRFEWVLEKATELGASRLIPVVAARCTVRTSSRGAFHEGRRARWHRIVQAAALQCGRATLPQLDGPTPFTEVINAAVDGCVLLFTLSPEAVPLAEHLEAIRKRREATVLIGPEGDFSVEEVTYARGLGGRLARLGGLTLRSETAAVATLAILQHALGTL